MTFYKISDKSESFAQPQMSGIKFRERCSICGRGGEMLPPLSIKFERRNIPDFSFLSPEIIVTDRVREVFENHGISGIEFLQISYQGDPRLLQGKILWHLHVQDKLPAAKSCNIVLLNDCENCGRKEYSTWDNGLMVNEEAGTTHDIFRVEEHWGHVFISERVKDIIEKENLVNVKFTIDKEVVDTLNWMRPRP